MRYLLVLGCPDLSSLADANFSAKAPENTPASGEMPRFAALYEGELHGYRLYGQVQVRGDFRATPNKKCQHPNGILRSSGVTL